MTLTATTSGLAPPPKAIAPTQAVIVPDGRRARPGCWRRPPRWSDEAAAAAGIRVQTG